VVDRIDLFPADQRGERGEAGDACEENAEPQARLRLVR
jgi:hypothetical protein